MVQGSAQLWLITASVAGVLFAGTAAKYVTRESSSATVIGGNGFSYYGGRLMVDPITIYMAWVGNWSESSKEAIRNAVRSLNEPAEFPSLSNWWHLLTQYNDSSGRPVSSKVSLSRTECYVDIQNLTIAMLNEAVRGSCNSVFLEEQSSSYLVAISKQVRTSGLFGCNGDSPLNNPWPYSWVREPQLNEYCNLWRMFGEYQRPPNGDTSLDSTISLVLAAIAERATNMDGNGWKDDGYSTVTSKCPSPTGWDNSNGPVMEEEGISWNLFGVNGSKYLVQQLWSQKSDNCALQIIDSCNGVESRTVASGIISQGLIMNHKVGLQPYRPGVACMWFIRIPQAKIIRTTLNYMAIGRTDELKMSTCSMASYLLGNPQELSFCWLTKSMTGLSSQVSLPDAVSSDLLIDFRTSLTQTAQALGWEIEYRAGYCYEILNYAYDFNGTISDGSPDGEKYLDNHSCKWILDAREGTNVHLQFTRFDTVAGLDVLTIYKGQAKNGYVLDNFSGSYTDLPQRTYVGPVSLVFTTKTGDGSGWAVDFVMDHPAGLRLLPSNSHLVAIMLGGFSGMLSLLLAAKLLHLLLLTKVMCCKSMMVRRFSKEELEAATDNFRIDNMVAPELFRGVLTNDQPIAVQRFPKYSCDKERELLSRIKHPNVTTLLGVCYDVKDSFMLFKNLSNGSVSGHLFGDDEKSRALSWERRLTIAAQVSRAVGYLHTYAEPCVVHGSLSSRNVFLDSSWNARLGGFGNAVMIVGDQSSGAEARLKAEDVYRMGSLILELVMGKCGWDSEEKQLSVAARCAAGLIDRGGACLILDWRLPKRKCSRALVKIAEIGAWCVREKTSERPNMMEVAAVLGQVEAMCFGAPPLRRRNEQTFEFLFS